MPRTVSAELSASLARDGVDIRHLVGITPAGTELLLVDGADSQFGLSNSVISIKPTTTELDAFEGTSSSGGVSIRMKADGVARALIVNFPLKNKAVRVALGTTEIVTGDFSTIWRGYIDDWSVEASGEITFECKDALAYLRDTEITFGVIGVHPLEAIRLLLEEHVPADLWSSTTFDFKNLPTTITHWNLSRYEAQRKHIAEPDGYNWSGSWDGRFRHNYLGELEGFSGSLAFEPRPAWDLVQDLLVLLNGVIYLDDNGRLAFRRRTATTTIDRYFAAEDLWDWSQPETVANLTNRVDVKVSIQNGSEGSDYAFATGKELATDRIVRGDDADSQADFAYYGSGIDRVLAATLGNDWLRMAAQVAAGYSSAATEIDIKSASLLGFTGARYRRGFRGPAASGTEGGFPTSAVSVTSNVATATCVGHWFETGDYISTTGLSVNVSSASPVALTVVDADHVSFAMITSNGALADGVGVLVPEQAPIDTLTGGREAYFLIAWGDGDDQYEIVRATAGVPTPSTYVQRDHRGQTSSTINQYSHPHSFRYTIARGEQGTIARTIPNFAIVWDITIPVANRDERLHRFARGAPKVAFKVHVARGFDLQVGDIIAHDQPMFVMEGIDGAGINTGFELTSVSLDEGESPPCASLEAVWKFNTTLPAVTIVPTITAQPIPPVMRFIGEKRSIYFDGYSPRFLRVAYNSSLSSSGLANFGISFWLNPVAALSAMTDQAMMSPIGRWESGQRVFKVVFLASGQMRVYIANHISTDTGSNYVATTGVAVHPNTWHHFVIDYGSSAVTIYRDGVAMATTTVGTIPGTLTAGTSRLEIGANGDAANICRGVFMTHAAIFRGSPDAGQRDLFVANPANGVPGAPGEPGQIDGMNKLRSWWTFATHLQDVIDGNALAPAGSGSTDPRFDTRYPPL